MSLKSNWTVNKASGLLLFWRKALLMIENVLNVEVSKDENSATITMGKHIPLDRLQRALPEKYQISAQHHSELAEQSKGWLATYLPILLIFFYITLVTLLVQFSNDRFDSIS